MDTTHTPGPWSRNIPPARKYSTIFAGRNTHIAMVQSTGLTDLEIEANTDLIAAAPDLLAALEALTEWGRTWTSPIGTNSPLNLLIAACAAITKAKGGN